MFRMMVVQLDMIDSVGQTRAMLISIVEIREAEHCAHQPHQYPTPPYRTGDSYAYEHCHVYDACQVSFERLGQYAVSEPFQPVSIGDTR